MCMSPADMPSSRHLLEQAYVNQVSSPNLTSPHLDQVGVMHASRTVGPLMAITSHGDMGHGLP
jgi:hypothetical protein